MLLTTIRGRNKPPGAGNAIGPYETGFRCSRHLSDQCQTLLDSTAIGQTQRYTVTSISDPPLRQLPTMTTLATGHIPFQVPGLLPYPHLK